jgi:hypothetical protein
MTGHALLVVACGVAVGVLTSFGQTHLGGAAGAFVNSASAWLVVPFLVGSRMPSIRAAEAAGAGVCALQLVGYDVTSELRGFPTGGGLVVFWTGCVIVGGPMFGAGGRAWRTSDGGARSLGAAVLPAAFLAEGAWVYLHELHHYATGGLWIGIGVLLAATMVDGILGLRWLSLAVAAAVLGEVLLTRIYTQSF